MWPFIAVFTIAFGLSAYLFRPEQPKFQKPSFDGDQIPVAKAGDEFGVLFGTKRIKGVNTAWYGNLRTKAIKR